MKEFYTLLERFESIKKTTGGSKLSSFCVELKFNPWDDEVTVELGGYDIEDWSRHEYRTCKREELLQKFEEWIKQAEDIVSKYENSDSRF